MTTEAIQTDLSLQPVPPHARKKRLHLAFPTEKVGGVAPLGKERD
jgi:hypothetical protein